MKEVHCISCTSELKYIGYEPLSNETYYICPNCDADYEVTETEDGIVIARINNSIDNEY